MVIIARTTTTLDLPFDHEATLGQGASPILGVCPNASGGALASAADVDALIGVFLHQLASDPDTCVMPASDPVFILDHTTVDGQRHVVHVRTQDAARRFVAKTRAEIQFDAENHPDGLAYLDLRSIELAGTCATVTIDARVAVPTRHHDEAFFGCSAVAVYENHGAWSFVPPMLRMCP